eukprot:gene17780-24155_t
MIAAGNGDLEMLLWLHAQGVTCNSSCANFGFACEHEEILQFLESLEERPRVVKKCAWGSISPEVPKSQSTFGQGPPPQVQQARRQDRQPDSQEFDKTSSGFSIGIIRSRWISCFEVSPGGIVVKPGACSFDFRIRPSFGLAIEQQYW